MKSNKTCNSVRSHTLSVINIIFQDHSRPCLPHSYLTDSEQHFYEFWQCADQF